MSLEPLINQQSIQIDNHSRGNRQEVSPKGVHIHKRMNEQKYDGVEVKIYFDGIREQIEFSKNIPDKLKKRLEREIKSAFKGKSQNEKFTKFFEDFFAEFDKFYQNEQNELDVKARVENQVKYLTSAARSLGNIFKYKEENIGMLIGIISNQVKEFHPNFSSSDRKLCISYLLNFDEKRITTFIGNNSELLKKWGLE